MPMARKRKRGVGKIEDAYLGRFLVKYWLARGDLGLWREKEAKKRKAMAYLGLRWYLQPHFSSGHSVRKPVRERDKKRQEEGEKEMVLGDESLRREGCS